MARKWYLAGAFLIATLSVSRGSAETSAALNDLLPDDPAAQQSTSQESAGAVPAPQAQQAPAQQTAQQSSQDQLHKQEQQRVLGIMPAFNVTNNRNSPPLTPRQKFQLFFKSTTDPWAFGLAGFQAGLGQAQDSPPEYGQGAEGYAKRFGANYADTFDGNLWGNAILTSWWHEDPRFYRKGSGSFVGRAGWAAASTVWSKRDKGTWGPNYANVIGNWIGSAIANVYYPASERTVGQTIKRGAETTAYGIIGAEVLEFWPDIANHYTKKRREKKALEDAQRDARQSGVQNNP